MALSFGADDLQGVREVQGRRTGLAVFIRRHLESVAHAIGTGELLAVRFKCPVQGIRNLLNGFLHHESEGEHSRTSSLVRDASRRWRNLFRTLLGVKRCPSRSEEVWSP